MNIAVAYRPAQGSCRHAPLVRVESGRSRLRSLLLIGVAGGVLLASVGGAAAEDFTWAGLTGKKELDIWEDKANWISGGVRAEALPTAGDTLTIASGSGSLGVALSVDTLNHNGGNSAIGHYGVLNVSTFNLNGGKYKQSNGGPLPVFLNGPPGITNVSTLLNITGGSLSGQGEVNVGANGKIVQSGGTVDGGSRINTPSYQQSGGTMGGRVTLDTLFTLSGDGALVTGEVIGDGDATMIQSGGRMDGGVSGIATYTQTGGQMSGNVTTDAYYAKGGSLEGRVDFSQLFALSGDNTTVEWVDLVGARDAVMTQTGGTMAGAVFNEFLDVNSVGIATYSQSGGEMSGWVAADTYELSGGSVTGSVEFSELFALSASGNAAWGSYLRGDGDAAVTQSGGTMEAGVTGIASYSQSGGTMNSNIAVDRYTQSGGTIAGAVSADTYEFAGGTGDGFENVTIGSTLLQSGGVFDRDGVVVPIFTQSGGLFSGSINAQTYNLTGAGATSTGGTITASDRFNLGPASGTATVDARLSGAGGIVKSGDSTVVLTNAANSFSGTVVIETGVLEVIDDALPDAAAVTIDANAKLVLTANNDTTFMGTISGTKGSLIKQGLATYTLGGTVALGDLAVNGGWLNIGTGESTNEASFDSAIIATGATLYIASGATLTIRIPNSIVNNGHLINDGTVHDDLNNTNLFDNNALYHAHVASNTATINNNANGVWEGNVLANAGKIRNYNAISWTGDIVTNAGTIENVGANTRWTGDVRANTGSIDMFGNAKWFGDVLTNAGWINNSQGIWTGDVKGNSKFINNYGTASWIGNVKTNAGKIANDSIWTGSVLANSGTIDNTGTWTGAIASNAGVVWNHNGGSWTGDVTTDNQIWNGRPDGSGGGLWAGDILGNNNAIFNFFGSTWTGDVIANGGGTNRLAQIDNLGAWNGAVESNAGWIFNVDGIWTGDVEANTNGIFNNHHDATTNPGGVNAAAWVGNVVTNAGLIGNAGGGTWTGNVAANTGTIDNSGIWTGDFTSAGTVNAQNRINGAFSNSGLLHLTGNLAGITTLSNSGRLDLTGNGAAQTLTVANVQFSGSPFYDIDVDATGASDTIIADTATLAGTVRVKAAASGGTYDLQTSYTILSATSITGTFTGGVTTDLAFLTPSLDYSDTTKVKLTLARNGQGFATAGATDNQRAVAETLEAGNAVYDAFLFLTQEQAQAALDDLSGEAYASAENAMIESASRVGEIAMNRIDQAFDAVGNGDGSASGYAAGPALEAGPTGDTGFWSQFYGAIGSVAATENTAEVGSATGGVAVGADVALDEWRVGVMLQAGATNTSVAALDSVITSTDYGIGVYGGRQWGDTRLSLGAAYTRHDISSTRGVAMPGFTDALSAAYGAGTAQLNAKLSHEFDLGAMSLTPYASVAYLNHATDGFVEAGGAAALTGAAGVVDATFTTVGLTVDRQFLVGDDMLLTSMASIGWRHAFTDDSSAALALADAPGFTVIGSPVVDDMAAFTAGLTLDINAANTVNLSYDGRIGGGSQEHTLTGTWAAKF